jgi:uncharacterized protein YbjT (DUF2867 family)
MQVILFGTTGMVGQSALRACLQDPEVTRVLSIGRTASNLEHPKLRELLQPDLFDLSSIADQLSGYDACLFCLGVSAAGMSAADYRRITYDLTLSIARTLLERSPALTFIYVSGAGTDPAGRATWARVKGETEQALLGLGFKAAYMFRPGFIQPLHGERSKTPLYHAIYTVLAPLYPLISRIAGPYVATSDQVARAMLAAAKRGAATPVLENTAIVALA